MKYIKITFLEVTFQNFFGEDPPVPLWLGGIPYPRTPRKADPSKMCS